LRHGVYRAHRAVIFAIARLSCYIDSLRSHQPITPYVVKQLSTTAPVRTACRHWPEIEHSRSFLYAADKLGGLWRDCRRIRYRDVVAMRPHLERCLEEYWVGNESISTVHVTPGAFIEIGAKWCALSSMCKESTSVSDGKKSLRGGLIIRSHYEESTHLFISSLPAWISLHKSLEHQQHTQNHQRKFFVGGLPA